MGSESYAKKNLLFTKIPVKSFKNQTFTLKNRDLGPPTGYRLKIVKNDNPRDYPNTIHNTGHKSSQDMQIFLYTKNNILI